MMAAQTLDLTGLSDRDLMLNLWLNVVLGVERADIDPEWTVMSVVRADQAEPAPDEEQITLSQLLGEVERRLGIDGFDVEAWAGTLQ